MISLLLQLDKPSDFEQKVYLVIITSIIALAGKWLFDRRKITSEVVKNDSDSRKSDAQLLMEMQEKLAVWIQRFQDVKQEVIGLEDEVREAKREIEDCLDKLEDCDKLKARVAKIFKKLQAALSGFVEHQPLLTELQELQTELEGQPA